ncbi:peptidase M16 [Leminorella grimontii]|uniref:Peptidase M16 n=2 Tax=Leminorella grimontii TaxID=82981 RepID=A0AAV5N399_9GAMM|nr:pitrilysin family protein [Leminorella grimontii]KFC93678.1 putative peptidase [Leminorella grimontii ATCC 33999 = DSM 5078]GKX55624.1 peptidase M16 [Leminorella grimontii]
MHSQYLFSALGGLMFLAVGASVQAEPLRADPAWQVGKLDNGFKWQILSTPHRPTDNVEIRLEVNAGSLQEGIPQVGFSYLLPRLAVAGTPHFSHESLDALLPQIAPAAGAKPLVDVSYDYTRYSLSFPPSRPELLKEAFSWLSDAVSKPKATDEQIQSVRADWLSPRLALPQGMSEPWWRYRIKNSPLVDHDPGQPVAEGATIQQLGEFYAKWYTPDAMTLYVVGNVDRRQLMEQIGRAFGGLAGKREAPATIAALSALPAEPINFLSTEVEKDRLTLVWDEPWHPIVASAPLERQWLDNMAQELITLRLNQRLAKSGLKGVSLDFSCQVMYQRNACKITIDSPLTGLKPSLKYVGTEIAKLSAEGATEAEYSALVAEKKERLSQVMVTYAKTDTAAIMDQRLLIEKSGSIGVAPELYMRLRQAFLDSMTLQVLNAHIHQRLTVKPTLVLRQPTGETEENVKALAEMLEGIISPAPKGDAKG